MAMLAAALVVGASGTLLVSYLRGPSASATPTGPPPVLTVVSTSPSGDGAASGSSIAVRFSTDLASGTPLPTLAPAIAGNWAVLSPSLLEYRSAGPLVPGSAETLTIPGGAGGVVGSRGQHLASTVTDTFTVASGSTLRLQQLLAELGYLPLDFTAATPVTSPTQEADDQVGTFTWRWPDQALALTSSWVPGTYNVVTKGAVMSFEAQHGLKTDGLPGPQVWSDLLGDVQSGQGDALPYDYVVVSQALPQTATVYDNGASVFKTLVSTGVAAAPTENGTWPVYLRYTVTTMSGTNPDGSKYVDPGIPWVSYFHGGDALHGFIRSSYGFPQSVGCVEIPPANAKVIYPLTPIGTLVTVQ
ncbi:MAG TPA: L,D-transpeptidase family protein [Acidimicrobiales bacterium]|nr:L,D-transpeptidase family protein [Acidimicrobiales bacterium]